MMIVKSDKKGFFKFVSLRKPKSYTVNITSFSSANPHLDDISSEKDLNKIKSKSEAFVDEIEPISEEEFKQSFHAQLLDLLKDEISLSPDFLDRKIEFKVNKKILNYKIPELVNQKEFIKEIQLITNTWLLHYLIREGFINKNKYPDLKNIPGINDTEDALRITNLLSRIIYDIRELSDPLLLRNSLSAAVLPPKTLIASDLPIPEEFKKEETDFQFQQKYKKAKKNSLELYREVKGRLKTLENLTKDIHRIIENASQEKHKVLIKLNSQIKATDEEEKFSLRKKKKKADQLSDQKSNLEAISKLEKEPLVNDKLRKTLSDRLEASEDKRKLSSDIFGENLKNFNGSVLDIQNSLNLAYEKLVKEGVELYAEVGDSELYPFNPPQVLEPPLLWPAGEVPPTINSIGFGDLILAQESVIGYEAKEIAHIENILPGEKRSREHSYLKSTETVLEEESIEELEKERDLQTSERFELQFNTEKVIETDLSINTGVNVSADYGTYKIDASLDVAFDRSVSESRSSASKYAKNITERAVERTRDFARSLRKVTILTRTEEKNLHEFNRQNNDKNGYSGVYNWVDKIHEVELRHWGTRLMLELFIPEPAVFLLSKNTPQGNKPAPPPPLPSDPKLINEINYSYLIDTFKANGIEPPPPYYRTTGFSWNNESESQEGNNSVSTDSGNIEIPEGYVPNVALVSVSARDIVDDFQAFVSINGEIILDYQYIIENIKWKYGQVPNTVYYFKNKYITQDQGLPYSIRLFGHNKGWGTVNVMILCERSNYSFSLWQLETYEKLKDGYNQLYFQYQEELDKYEREKKLKEDQISGRNPNINRKIEKEELKKWAIQTLRLRSFSWNSVSLNAGIEEIDPAKAVKQSKITRFFEQVFEWDQLAYFLYPYFWGRRDTWRHKKSLIDPDPLHETFLRAGAARVILPVTSGMEQRILNYLTSVAEEEDRISEPLSSATSSLAPGLIDPALWQEVVMEKYKDMQLGSGTIKVVQGSDEITLMNSTWVPEPIDIGREIFIEGVRYEIADVVYPNKFMLDRPYERDSKDQARYLTGSVRLGSPWRVSVPTNMVILEEEKDKLLSPDS